VLDSAELYDPIEGKFTAIAPMTAHRDRHAAVLLRDGRVLIVGGVDTVLVPMIVFPGPTMPSILASTEIFDPSKGTFGPAFPMATARDVPTATLLIIGKVLVAGGGDDGAELYDPRTKKFSATGNLTEGRYGQTATLLPDGRVLMAGGGDAVAEIYNPAIGNLREPAR